MRTGKTIAALAGTAALLATAVAAMNGPVWAFVYTHQHRFTSAAMLAGSLRLHRGIALVESDEQVFHGAGYTNWGYGVPLLQMPFHALARRLGPIGTVFFPDRAIFFAVLVPLLPLLWWSLHRTLAGGAGLGGGVNGAARRTSCSLAATFAVLACALYPFVAYRFIIYEETVAYLVVAELYALCACVHARRSRGLLPVAALAAAAGFGMLVRATGLVYVGVWAALCALDGRGRAARRLGVFAAVLAPFVAFWAYTNAVKSGSPLSFGYPNSVPYYSYHVPIQRFGSVCADTPAHAVEVVLALLRSFFFDARPALTRHLEACHFTVELQEPATSPHAGDAFFGLLVPLGVAAILVRHALRRERLVVWIAPAALLLLFGSYAWAAIGFVWRYAADFWPLIVLVAVQYAERARPLARSSTTAWAIAAALTAVGGASFARHVLPVRASVMLLRPTAAQQVAIAAQMALDQAGIDWPYPSHLSRYEPFPRRYERTAGWLADGAVDTFTNLYLGVPPKGDGPHELMAYTAGMDAPSVRVFVDGRVYRAVREYSPEGARYRAVLDLDDAALVTPTVMVTFEWTRALAPPAGAKLVAIELR